MKIRMKFLILTVVVSMVLVIVSLIGYYTAQNQLMQSIERELDTSVDYAADDIDNWLQLKAQNVVTVAKTMNKLDPAVGGLREMMSCMEGDPDFQDFYNGMKDGTIIKWEKSALPPNFNPVTRSWYKDAVAKDGLIFTDAYIDAATKTQVVTAAYPYKNASGQAQGVIGADISLNILNQQVAKIKLRDRGKGFIIDRTGTIVAHVDADKISKKIEENHAFKEHIQEMMTNDNGKFVYEENGEKKILTYAKVHKSGWVVGMEIPEAFVYSELYSLRWSYGGITLFGVLLMVLFNLRFSAKITAPIVALQKNAEQLSAGNLRVEKLSVNSNDEIGNLMTAFNIMSDTLRKLIQQVAISAERITAAAEELTAGAGQSAEAANHVATTITKVANGMAMQMQTIGMATQNIEAVADDVDQVSQNTRKVVQITNQTAESAQAGEKLMAKAIAQMESIEQTVANSATVVSRLGENSQQIGQIVSVISGIAGQTNLLSLNAAIEAARAGEQGRGFAVVAEEVRKLAEQSQKATEEITKLVASIQQDTSQAVATMDNGTTEVKVGSAAIQTVGNAFKDILVLVEEMIGQMRDISTAMQHVSAGSKGVVSAVEEINQVSRDASSQTQTISAATEEQSASMEEIASSAQSLSQMAQEMQMMISKFKL